MRDLVRNAHLLSLCILCLSQAAGRVETKYTNQENWPDKCLTGDSQSPIDLKSSYFCPQAQNGDLKLTPLKDTILSATSRPSLYFSGKHPFLELQFSGNPDATWLASTGHFHTPSEHTIDGKQADGEMYLIFQSPKGEFTVVGFFLEVDPDLREDSCLVSTMSKGQLIAGETVYEFITPALTSMWTSYSGSLTTPPCTEGINWVIFKAPLQICPQALKLISETPNSRKVQNLNGRALPTCKQLVMDNSRQASQYEVTPCSTEVSMTNEKCPGLARDCELSEWPTESKCPPCGFQSRERSVAVEPAYGGEPCPEASLVEIASCPCGKAEKESFDFPECQYSEWSAWSPCETCNLSARTRTYMSKDRHCESEEPLTEFQQCECDPQGNQPHLQGQAAPNHRKGEDGIDFDDESPAHIHSTNQNVIRKLEECSVVKWTPWQLEEGSLDCSPIKTYVRHRVLHPTCLEVGYLVKQARYSPGFLTSWSSWSECDAYTGRQIRSREVVPGCTISDSSPRYIPVAISTFQVCEPECPVEGWSNWLMTSSCSEPCVMKRYRTDFSHNEHGKPCTPSHEPALQIRECTNGEKRACAGISTEASPDDQPWSSYSECSATECVTDQGFRLRSRKLSPLTGSPAERLNSEARLSEQPVIQPTPRTVPPIHQQGHQSQSQSLESLGGSEPLGQSDMDTSPRYDMRDTPRVNSRSDMRDTPRVASQSDVQDTPRVASQSDVRDTPRVGSRFPEEDTSDSQSKAYPQSEFPHQPVTSENNPMNEPLEKHHTPPAHHSKNSWPEEEKSAQLQSFAEGLSDEHPHPAEIMAQPNGRSSRESPLRGDPASDEDSGNVGGDEQSMLQAAGVLDKRRPSNSNVRNSRAPSPKPVGGLKSLNREDDSSSFYTSDDEDSYPLHKYVVTSPETSNEAKNFKRRNENHNVVVQPHHMGHQPDFMSGDEMDIRRPRKTDTSWAWFWVILFVSSVVLVSVLACWLYASFYEDDEGYNDDHKIKTETRKDRFMKKTGLRRRKDESNSDSDRASGDERMPKKSAPVYYEKLPTQQDSDQSLSDQECPSEYRRLPEESES